MCIKYIYIKKKIYYCFGLRKPGCYIYNVSTNPNGSHMWADLNPLIKLIQISNNKPKTKKTNNKNLKLIS